MNRFEFLDEISDFLGKNFKCDSLKIENMNIPKAIKETGSKLTPYLQVIKVYR